MAKRSGAKALVNGALKRVVPYLVLVTLLLALLVTQVFASCLARGVRVQGEGLSPDLFTQRAGAGPSEPGGDFAVDEDVFLVCSVMYSDYPAVHCLVAFEVRDPLNESILIRAAVTDESGYATLTFRIPNLLSSNGTWAASAVASLSDLTASDTMDFCVFLHDVAIESIVPARLWVYQGHAIDINVTLLNQGFFENVTTTLFRSTTNDQILDTCVVSLLIGERLVVTFRWNTTGVPCCLNYSLAALASLSVEENDVSDNTLMDGSIHVRILGDIDGNDRVNLVDIWLVAQSFGFYEDELGYSFAADLNSDSIVDMIDLYQAAARFGQGAP